MLKFNLLTLISLIYKTQSIFALVNNCEKEGHWCMKDDDCGVNSYCDGEDGFW